MMTAGFQWGASSSSAVATHSSTHHPSRPRDSSKDITPAPTTSSKKKRRYVDDEDIPKTITTAHGRKYALPSSTKAKRCKTPRIIGQSLPTNRLIEVLDKLNLQNLLQDLLKQHPEIESSIIKLASKPQLSNSIKLLQDKFDSILTHLPYKCDVESDYSYLRIKPYLQEFFNCLSDFILNYLPPIETNILNSLTFLQEVTNLIHNLPNFANNEFQYTKNMAYEQIANTWLIVVSQEDEEAAATATGTTTDPATEEDSKQIISIIKDYDLIEKLTKHNEISNNKFQIVIDYLKSELEQHELVSRATSNPLSDFITVDYSNYSMMARTAQ
ncbi:Tethering factor for nuclear proteasome STS1 [Spathaspora sp. JA1]|nr:Tethering factor for nuclear proteasome STS1 [Spathaspora sp. JA1]